MAYLINRTDNNNGNITVNDNTTNTATSLGFPGRNQKGYAVTIAENFLHLLENFANATPPSTPIEGQLWYDTTPGINLLNVYDGTTWKPSGSLKKGSSEPEVASSIIGDLWVDTANQQLYLYNGANWILVGPTFSSGLLTGAKPDSVKDATTSQTEHVVLKNIVDDTVVSIISKVAFTPQSGITGFEGVKAGVNLSTNYKYWGTSEKAENLVIGGSVIPSVNFLRSDISNITTSGFTVKSDSGLNLGGDSQLQLRITEQTGVLYYSTPGSRFDIRLNVNDTGSGTHTETTLISLDSNTGRVGIGKNNLAPTETLSVNGTGSFSDQVKITLDTDTTNITTGALIIQGGVVVRKTLRVGGDIKNSGSIIPEVTNVNNIGSTDYKFSNVYATTINGDLVGNVTGNLTGTVTGNVTGSASRLVSSTVFSMTGDVVSSGFSFNGSSSISGKVFTTSISPTFVQNQTLTETTADTDEIILNRPFIEGGALPGLFKTTKKTFISSLPLVPIGAIFPFAGAAIPSGYLLCDGSEKQIGVYQDLYNVIGFIYTPDTANLIGLGTFKLPDLRGRFPLGLDNMDNGDKVPDKNSPNTISLIDSGGGTAGRVNASTASILGQVSGQEQVTLDTTQIPDHSHTLVGSTGGQYYAINNNAVVPNDDAAFLGSGPTGSNQAQYLPVTGNINTNQPVGGAVSLMNPYLSINYIIYSGVH